jgi:hypothetical protein
MGNNVLDECTASILRVKVSQAGKVPDYINMGKMKHENRIYLPVLRKIKKRNI